MLVRVMHYCIDRQTLSWKFKLGRPHQKVAELGMQTTALMRRHALLDRDSVSSSSNGCLVIGRVRNLRHERGMRFWHVGERKSKLNVTDTSMHTTDTGTKSLRPTTKRTLVALMPLCFVESLGIVPMVVAWSEAGNSSSATTAAYATIHNATVDPTTGGQLVDRLACEPGDGCLWLCSTCARTRSRSPEDGGWRLQHEAETL